MHSNRVESSCGWGITSFIEMPNTKPQTTTLEELEREFSIAEQDALQTIHLCLEEPMIILMK